MGTHVAVYNNILRNVRKNGGYKGMEVQKTSNFFAKKEELPLEKEKRLMYNSPVVCLGMKW